MLLINDGKRPRPAITGSPKGREKETETVAVPCLTWERQLSRYPDPGGSAGSRRGLFLHAVSTPPPGVFHAVSIE
jgi:hypothetical protein